MDPRTTLVQMFFTELIRPGMGAKYCDEYVCLSVSLSAHITRKPRFRTLPNFMHVAVPRSSSGGVAIRYVLPVLWIASYFHAWASWQRMQHQRRSQLSTIALLYFN